MLYAQRDAAGRIRALFREQPRGDSEPLGADHPEVLEFVCASGNGGRTGEWVRQDLAMARVVEDLVDVLIAKKVISLTDLPLAAQHKVVSRHGRRDDLSFVARLYPPAEGDELG